MNMTINLYRSLLPPLQDDFLRANLDALELSEAAKAQIESAQSEGQVIYLSDQTPVLRVSGHHYDVPRDEDDLRASAREAEVKQQAVVLYGLGLGHTLRTLRAHSTAPVIVYDPNPGLLRTALQFGPADLCGTPVVCSLHELSQSWTGLSQRRTAAGVVVTPGYEKHFLAERLTLERTLKELVQRTGSNEETYRQRAQDWAKNLLVNLDSLLKHPPAQALNGAFQGVPAFIVGAGPSLEKNAELLAEAARRGIVFAVNSSGKALASRGVTPHILGCMESMDVTALIKDLPFLDEVVKVFSLTAHPNTFKLENELTLPFYEAAGEIAGPMEQLTRYRGLTVCTSVSTAMFSLAEMMGCNPIVLVGQDLAYSNGKVYAAGSPYEHSRVGVTADGKSLELDWCDTLRNTHKRPEGQPLGNTREPLRSVTAWGGVGEVYTVTNFDAVRSWLQAASILLAGTRPELRLINATEGGSQVEGFEERTLASLLTEFPRLDISPSDLYATARARKAPLSSEAVVAWANGEERLTERVRRAARRVRRLAEVAMRGFEQDNTMLVNRSFSALEAAERSLSKRVRQAPLVDAWSFAAVGSAMKAARPEEGDARESAIASLRSECLVAREVERAAYELQLELTAIRRRIQEVSGIAK